MTKPNKIFKIILICLFSILVVFFICCVWLYTGQLTPAKTKILNSAPFPMAIVNGHMVPMSQFTIRYEISRMYDPSQNDSQIRSAVYSALIQQAAQEQIANKYGVGVSQKEIDEEYQRQKAQTGPIFEQNLKKYNITEADFKGQLTKPGLLNINLQIWYNTQRSLNPANYNLADDLLNKIGSGQSMGNLASDFTQDQLGKTVQGDMGYVDVATALPELKEPLATMKVEEVKIIASRYGLHIIKIEDKKNNQIHLRQILIISSGFNSWLASETKKLSIKQLIKI